MLSPQRLRTRLLWIDKIRAAIVALPPLCKPTVKRIAVALGIRSEMLYAYLSRYKIGYGDVGLIAAEKKDNHGVEEDSSIWTERSPTRRRWLRKIHRAAAHVIADGERATTPIVAERLGLTGRGMRDVLRNFDINYAEAGLIAAAMSQDERRAQWLARLRAVASRVRPASVRNVAGAMNVSPSHVRGVLRTYQIGYAEVGILNGRRACQINVERELQDESMYVDREYELRQRYPEVYAQIPSRFLTRQFRPPYGVTLPDHLLAQREGGERNERHRLVGRRTQTPLDILIEREEEALAFTPPT